MFPQHPQDPIEDHINVKAWEWAVENGHAKIGQEVTFEDLERWREMRQYMLTVRQVR